MPKFSKNLRKYSGLFVTAVVFCLHITLLCFFANVIAEDTEAVHMKMLILEIGKFAAEYLCSEVNWAYFKALVEITAGTSLIFAVVLTCMRRYAKAPVAKAVFVGSLLLLMGYHLLKGVC
jgi:hypothetical protein